MNERELLGSALTVATSGLASNRTVFDQALHATVGAIGLEADQIVHDYWLVRCLFGVSKVLPDDGVVIVPGRKKQIPERRVGKWAFGGGTSLTAAWGVVKRYSEDIDGSFFAEEEMSRSTFANVHKRFSRAACDAVEASEHETLGRMVRTTKISLEGQPNYLKLETTMQVPDDKLVAMQTVTSLIGKHSGIDFADEYPEVGGFRMACVRPEWTAVNKFDALHWRSETDALKGLTDRGRDLYDLWALSQTDHANAIRERTAELWERAASGIRTSVARPAHGYGTSAVFMSGTAANNALKVGYERSVEHTVWGNAPDFEQAIQYVRELDLE